MLMPTYTVQLSKNIVASNSCHDLFLAIGQASSSGSSESSTEFHFEELAAFITIISRFYGK